MPACFSCGLEPLRLGSDFLEAQLTYDANLAELSGRLISHFLLIMSANPRSSSANNCLYIL